MLTILILFAVIFILVLAFSSNKKQTVVRRIEPDGQDHGLKQCPDCAESVKADAKICRFCRHEFGRPQCPYCGSTSLERTSQSKLTCRACGHSGNFTLTPEAVIKIAASEGVVEVHETTGNSPAQSAAKAVVYIVIAGVVLVLGLIVIATANMH
jgi:uncharacterized paraquat-inducible protein A